jgi:predicted DNA-binding protein (MmcQ/YjbR family)
MHMLVATPHLASAAPRAIIFGMDNMDRLEKIIDRLPEAERVDIAEWGDHPTFRVKGKNFVFSDQAAMNLSLKLPKEEAAAVVATDPDVEPAGYGLGRHGWVALSLDEQAGDERWRLVEEWVRTSYTLVAPRKLARIVLAEDETSLSGD